MPTPVYLDSGYVYGAYPPEQIKPFKGWYPPGKIRFRFRNNSLAFVFFRTEQGIRKFIIRNCGPKHWELGYEQGSNVRL